MDIKFHGIIGSFKLYAVSALVLAVLSGLGASATAGSGGWWNVVPEQEIPSQYYDSILYSEIAPKLREIQLNSKRIKVDIIGQSAGGRNLFLASLSKGNNAGYKTIGKLMLSDPDKALKAIPKVPDLKVPVWPMCV